MQFMQACRKDTVQDTRGRNPSVEERFVPLRAHIAALTAMDQHHPPQSAKPMPEDLQLRRNGSNIH
jgi:hypothetical protein